MEVSFHTVPLSHPTTLASYWKLETNFIGYKQMQLYRNTPDISICHLSNKKEEAVNLLWNICSSKKNLVIFFS